MKNNRTFKSLPTYGEIESGLFHKPAVVRRSEQLQNCNCKRFKQKIDGRFYCRDCGKVEYTVL